MIMRLFYHRVYDTESERQWKLIAMVSCLSMYSDIVEAALITRFGKANIKIVSSSHPEETPE